MHRADILCAKKIGLVGRQDRVDAAHHGNSEGGADTEAVEGQGGARGDDAVHHTRQEEIQRDRARGEDHEGVAAADDVRHGGPDQTTT